MIMTQPIDPSRPDQQADLSRPLCAARSRRAGGPCQAYPVRGATVCSAHGGRAPQVKAAAARRRQLDVARQAMVTYGLPREIDPNDALLEEVHRTAGHVLWLMVQVQSLAPEALTWGMTERVDKAAGEFPGLDTTYAAVPPVLLELYLRERKHYVEASKAAIAAGVAERQVRVAERQGVEMAAVFRRVLGQLGLTTEQLALVPGLLRQEIAAITGGTIIEGSPV